MLYGTFGKYGVRGIISTIVLVVRLGLFWSKLKREKNRMKGKIAIGYLEKGIADCYGTINNIEMRVSNDLFGPPFVYFIIDEMTKKVKRVLYIREPTFI